MKIIIADAKTLKEMRYPIQGQIPYFEKEAQELLKHLELLEVEDIHDCMNLSFKQSSLIYDYFHNQEVYPAMNLYDGVVFKQLHLKNYTPEDYTYLEKHLLINSPLYGVLRYNDSIRFHRLEMKHKIADIHLYSYWKDKITDYLKDEDFILSLSTKEYEKMFTHPNVIQIDFVDIVGGQMKRHAIYLKQARGKMLDYMILHKVESLDEIKQISVDGYQYNEDLSTTNKFVFSRNGQMKYIKK